MSRRVTAILAIAAGAIGALTGCAKAVPNGMIAAPPPGATAPPTTPAPTVPSVSLLPVAGHRATKVVVAGGGASLSGTVTGPAGPVGGAEVHAERVTDDGVAAADTVSGADGSWVLAGVLGGIYRVRAWRAPDLDLVTPVIFFLANTDSKVLTLNLSSYTGTQASSAVNPTPASTVPFNIAIVVTSSSVDVNGVARATPLTFTKVQLTTTGDLVITSLNPAYTDANGRAEWQVTCQTTGPQAVTVVVNDTDALPLTLPPCGAAPATTTTTTGGATTTTSTPGGH